MTNEQTIPVDEDITDALDQIRAATGPIRLELWADSCKWGNVFDLLSVSNAMKNYPHRTTAVVKDCVSVIPLVGADEVEIVGGASVYISPLTMLSAGDRTEMLKAEDTMMRKLSDLVSKQLDKWPELRALFAGGGDHYLNAGDFKRLTKTKGESNG